MADHAAPSARRAPSGPWWAPAALAWSFLTIVPAPFVPVGPVALPIGVGLFPLVGFVLGALLGGAGLLLDRLLPPEPVAVLLLAAGALLTGGLHLDGLMDTADGVFGGKTVEQRLTILRDSRIGSFGALAGLLAILGEYACLSHLVGLARLVALVTALGLSRWAVALALAVHPTARPDGLGATFRRFGAGRGLALATLLALAGVAAVGPLGRIGFLLAAFVALGFGRFAVARLGGVTGDTYGAIAVLAEVATLYAATVR